MEFLSHIFDAVPIFICISALLHLGAFCGSRTTVPSVIFIPIRLCRSSSHNLLRHLVFLTLVTANHISGIPNGSRWPKHLFSVPRLASSRVLTTASSRSRRLSLRHIHSPEKETEILSWKACPENHNSVLWYIQSSRPL